MARPGLWPSGNPQNLRKCSLDDCRRPFYARGLCQPDYLRWCRSGRPDVFEPRPPRAPLPASFRVFTG